MDIVKALDPSMVNIPQEFKCPISMELMKNPVTISTGLTYERKSIEKWFFTYKKKTCPTTNQIITNFLVTPNLTLQRLILSWQISHSISQSSHACSIIRDELASLLNTIESTPFKVSPLRKLLSMIELGRHEIKVDFEKCGGTEVVVKIVVQILVDGSDFETFRACEEALGVLHQLILVDETEEIIQLFSKLKPMKAMAIMLQIRGSVETRFHTISIFQIITESDYNWDFLIQDQAIDLFKSLLELISDGICTKASSCALQVLIEIINSSKKGRSKAIEAGAIFTLIELLPESNRSRCEKMLQLIKLLCKCAEGRLAFIEHGLGIAVVLKKMFRVLDVASTIGVKILWLICSFQPTIRVLEEMLICGAMKKLVVLLHISGQSSLKDKVVKMFKDHGKLWMGYPCFPCELKDFLGL